MSHNRFKKKNHLLNCIVYMVFCAIIQVVLSFHVAKRPTFVWYIVAFQIVVAIGYIVRVVGEIIIMKMDLEQKENIERVRLGFYLYGRIWFGVTMVALSFLSFAYRNPFWFPA